MATSGNATQGERLMDWDFIHALEARYEDRQLSVGAAPSRLHPDSDEYMEIYGRICDAVVQLMWGPEYGTGPDDPSMHTSDPARRAANVLMIAAGYRPNRDES